MFLTKECDYAIRVVRNLSDLNLKSVKTICEFEHIPIAFAYKILKKLERANIVRAHRGTDGGYRLIQSPDRLTLLDIVSAVDHSLFLNECLREGSVCPRNTGGHLCGVHGELARVQKLLMDALREKNMAELLPATQK